ncbi:LacI family DNA-binding transcriptional regulator [Marivita sp. S2033]|uniref:LacI family DNA-binding transcriptional regulator n=1 Tax=Marivita sp. S2033 TaxID=3373187 RepID=UPI00398280CA
MLTKRPTIIDVARHAGVSKSTVSLVLQNSPLVKTSTKRHVEASMAALNYVYNRSAAKLRSAGTELVGLVINDLRNPFFTEFAASAQMAFARKGFATVIANTDEDSGVQAKVIESMIEHGVSAILVSPAYGERDALHQIERAGVPALQVLRKVDFRTDLFPFASLDYETGGTLATRHLIDLSARNIAFVGGLADRKITLERMTGYEAVLANASRQALHFPGRPSRAFGREMALAFADRHPDIDAAVCFSDLVALGMHAGFAEAGVTLGRDFRLVGFDDIEEASLVYPALSSVRCNIAEFGEQAAETMLAWIVDGIRPPEEKRSPVQLVARQSSTGKPVIRP